MALRELCVVLAIWMTFNQNCLDNDWARRRVKNVEQPLAMQMVVDRLRLYQGWRRVRD